MKRHPLPPSRQTQFKALVLGVLLAATVTGFALQSAAPAGVSMTKSATAWLGSLDDIQRTKALLAYDTPARRDWHFIPKAERKGLQIKEMTEPQRKLALELLRSGLSQIGYDKATRIMAVETLLKELEKAKTGTPLRDPERYYFTVFGKPSDSAKWGLSIEGHHMSFNFVVENNKVTSMTPNMYGANPAIMKGNEIAGFKPGMRLLAKEESLAFDLLGALNPEQRKKAVIAEEALKEVRTAGEPQPPTDAPAGIPASELTAEQRQVLQSLIEAYAGNFADDLARERLGEIEKAGIQKVSFAWAGADKPGIGHYYRVQGPTFVIEFVNTQPDAAGNPANHIHCTWRDVRGDFAMPVGQ